MKSEREQVPQYVWASLGCLSCESCPYRCEMDFRRGHSEHVQAAMMRLCIDVRMRQVWERGILRWGHLAQAAEEYSASLDRDHWAIKTQRERDLWLDKFEKAVETLFSLMEEGPLTPQQYGFPARDVVLASIARRLGVAIPPEPPAHQEFGDEHMVYWGRVSDLERAVDAEGWTLAHALWDYRARQRVAAASEQLVKKPGDPKAARAQFITSFRDSCSRLHSDSGEPLPHLSAQVVATIASIIFEDEAIDERLVRRLTREDSSES